ncbi:hypothetical protein QMK17_22220 [Rhodococcus sp. G-MC3]|uniref:hypothetical protein n=1 Tax=Rhodococcus sp. G-MC3 TaxID=3046209 RepID=UPI0024B944A0|nr:hypothetical protein [Rhodococcus sp. G-MC3]MDJ0396042.1 hypothetical protein [Rhodococcus sp. G-MC3]
MDPEPAESGWGDGIVVGDWLRCVFRSPDPDLTYFLNVKSSLIHTIVEARENPSNLQGEDLRIGAHDAFRYKTSVAKSVVDCNVAVELDPGLIVFTVNFMEDSMDEQLPCDIALAHTSELESALPITA